MPVSLNLPRPICAALTRLARTHRKNGAAASTGNSTDEYIDYQYRSSDGMRRRYMEGIEFADRVVLDVGSGLGGRSPYFVEAGARHVYCIDVNRHELAAGSRIIAQRFPNASNRIAFRHPDDVKPDECGDVAMLVDCFEHLIDPAAVLRQVYAWLKPGGIVWIGSIGWYHYAASHCLGHIPIPWCQMLFSEQAILETIRRLLHSPGYEPNQWERLEGLDRWDKVRSLKDRPGEPLNMLSLRAVRQVLKASPFELDSFKVYGFSGTRRKLGRLLSGAARLPLLNEMLHSYYSAILVKRDTCNRKSVVR